jgi:nitroreductase
MDAIKAMLTRRSIREFSQKKVPKNLIKDILEAGIHAPSSKNSQPWYFVVDTTEKKDKIADLLEKGPAEEFTPMDPRTGKPAVKTTSVASARILREAPAAIFIFSKAPFTGGRDEVLKKPELAYLLSYTSEVESIAASTQNMLLAAHSLGLGAVWLSDISYVEEEIKKMYNKSEGDFMLVLALGYPKSQPKHTIDRLENYEFV